ncbi:MAG: ArsR family transcriptional regulator [bacterium]|nr:ArsR family transcriptional regulator [bacterium]
MSSKSLEILLGSKNKVKILKSLFRNDNKNFSVSELANLTQIDVAIVRKEIKTLLEAGLIKTKTS